MEPIYYIDRESQEKKEEQVYGGAFVFLLYGKYPLCHVVRSLLFFLTKYPWFSKLYGKIQDSSWTRKKITRFVKKYKIDLSECEKKLHQFQSFNDFFYRKLKPGSRVIEGGADKAVIPADGRYLFVPKISDQDGFYVKGKKFCLETFLQSKELAHRYKNGLMVIARLCPVDYHRFHFPCHGVAEKPKLINGHLGSVNLLSLKNNIEVFTENRRMRTLLNTENFGQVVYCEVGAVCVGSIIQTMPKNGHFQKGDEKGYFAFGGSSLVLLFEENKLNLSPDLINQPKHLEILCKFGQIMGSST